MTNFDKNYNVFPLILLIIASIGIFWLNQTGIPAASSYMFMAFIGLLVMFIAFVSVKESDNAFNIQIPLHASHKTAAFVFLIGFFLLIFITVLGNVFSIGFIQEVNSQATIPLASFRENTAQATFAQLDAAASPFWQFFVVGWTAPVFEEFVFGFFLPIGFIVAVFGLRKMFGWDFGPNANTVFDFVLSFVFTMIIFSALHAFNSTYTSFTPFFIAFVFRGLLNIAIYWWRFGLSFAIGLHMANNWGFLGSKVGEGLLTFPGGLVIVLFVVIPVLVIFLRTVFSGELGTTIRDALDNEYN